jgi:hypothetical protein
MNTELSTPASPVNPFARQLAEHVNAGTVEIESSRAVAEAQGSLVIAQRFPRNQAKAYDDAMNACRRPGLAEEAIYTVPRGKESASGPTIRLVEELARVWGNIEYGVRELSRSNGVSEMQAFAWDLQTNTKALRNFSVKHWRDTKGGGYALSSEQEIYELTANQGGRRLRACIEAILPHDLVRDAENECKRTLAGNSEEPIADRVRKMLAAFSKLGVTPAMIESRLGHSLDSVLPEEFSDMRGVINSLKTGMSKAGDWFGGVKVERESSDILDTPATAATPSTRARKPTPATDTPPEPEPPATAAEAKPADDVFDA